MKYINANVILPEKLIEEIQKYIQGKYIYIPIKNKIINSWDESIENLAQKYYLSVDTIRKILYKK